jgi:hypothetical protein
MTREINPETVAVSRPESQLELNETEGASVDRGKPRPVKTGVSTQPEQSLDASKTNARQTGECKRQKKRDSLYSYIGILSSGASRAPQKRRLTAHSLDGNGSMLRRGGIC